MTTENSETSVDVKAELADKKRRDERERAQEQGTRGVTGNALRGMNDSGTVNVDDTGDVADNNELKVAETIDLSAITYHMQVKSNTIADMLFNSGYSVVFQSFTEPIDTSENTEGERFVMNVYIYDGVVQVLDNEVMFLTVSVSTDNTAVISTKTDGEFDVAPVVEAVGNIPVLDRIFYDFKKQVRDDLIRDIVDERKEELRGMYASKKSRERMELQKQGDQ